jgi:hypothetical protein
MADDLAMSLSGDGRRYERSLFDKRSPARHQPGAGREVNREV